jgi:hypothetical protein
MVKYSAPPRNLRFPLLGLHAAQARRAPLAAELPQVSRSTPVAGQESMTAAAAGSHSAPSCSV